MVIESGLIKPVVDAILALLQGGRRVRLKRDAERALQEAIRELLTVNPDHNKAAARIAVAFDEHEVAIGSEPASVAVERPRIGRPDVVFVELEVDVDEVGGGSELLDEWPGDRDRRR